MNLLRTKHQGSGAQGASKMACGLPMNPDIGGPRSVVAHFRDPTERVPPFPVRPPNACAKRRAALPEPPTVRRRSEHGIMLLDCLVYIAIWTVVAGLATAVFFRLLTHTKHLNRNAAEIVRTLKTGERWRQDVREAAGELDLVDSTDAQTLRIPKTAGEVAYLFRQGTVYRRGQADAPWLQLLPGVKSSRMQKDRRLHVVSWRWEIELKSRQKTTRVQPLFSFEAVAVAASGRAR
jgi:hypothetical protein